MTTITKTRKIVTRYGRQETKFVYTAENGRVMRTSFTEYSHVNSAMWTFHSSAAAAARRASGSVITIVDGDAESVDAMLARRARESADAERAAHERFAARPKLKGYAITIRGPQEPATVAHLVSVLGWPETSADAVWTYFWHASKGPIPNLCDCGLNPGAEIEAVYAA